MMKQILPVLIISWSLQAKAVPPIVKGDGVAKTKERMTAIFKAATDFYTDCGFYPESIYGLIVDIDHCNNWGPEPYIAKAELLSDIWARPLIYYKNANSGLTLKSLGPTESDKKSPRGEISMEGP